jgi:hypothetical protein
MTVMLLYRPDVKATLAVLSSLVSSSIWTIISSLLSSQASGFCDPVCASLVISPRSSGDVSAACSSDSRRHIVAITTELDFEPGVLTGGRSKSSEMVELATAED